MAAAQAHAAVKPALGAHRAYLAALQHSQQRAHQDAQDGEAAKVSQQQQLAHFTAHLRKGILSGAVEEVTATWRPAAAAAAVQLRQAEGSIEVATIKQSLAGEQGAARAGWTQPRESQRSAAGGGAQLEQLQQQMEAWVEGVLWEATAAHSTGQGQHAAPQGAAAAAHPQAPTLVQQAPGQAAASAPQLPASATTAGTAPAAHSSGAAGVVGAEEVACPEGGSSGCMRTPTQVSHPRKSVRLLAHPSSHWLDLA